MMDMMIVLTLHHYCEYRVLPPTRRITSLFGICVIVVVVVVFARKVAIYNDPSRSSKWIYLWSENHLVMRNYVKQESEKDESCEGR